MQDSTIPTYKKLNAFMESTKPSVMTDGNKAGLDRVRRILSLNIRITVNVAFTDSVIAFSVFSSPSWVQVRKEEGSYAFFMEAASIEYNMQQYCDLR